MLDLEHMRNFRLIPAGAGKTAFRRGRASEVSAHPRRCGENRLPLLNREVVLGSSPQVRGKQHAISHPRNEKPAHPRRCGENRRISWNAGCLYGSSPQVRGKRSPRPSQHPCTRLIPAGAGKTLLRGGRESRLPAHPRRCGENEVRIVDKQPLPGSSPQVRGKRRGLSGGFGRIRLIPAGAGKTSFEPDAAAAAPAHPRRCGENSRLLL